MLKTLDPQQLTLRIDPANFDFASTAELVGQRKPNGEWIGQAEAETAARFGLGMPQPGFHLIVIGEPGCGRTSLMLKLMHEYAAGLPVPPDLLYLHNFEQPEKPMSLRVAAGTGAKLRQTLDRFIRILARCMPTLASDATAVEDLLQKEFAEIRQVVQAESAEQQKLESYLAALRQDVFDNIDLFLQVHSIAHAQAQAQNAPQNLGTELMLNAENEGMLESYLARFRANLLVDHRQQAAAPVIYDDDPTYQSLFGSYESGEQAGNLPEFMRLRAGNLLRADGGMLMLHLRDLHGDHHNGPQILEKLRRFLRNGRVQIEESVSHGGQAAITHPVSEPLPVEVRLVLIASREEYYRLQDEAEEFVRFFNVKVDFTDDFPADKLLYRQIAAYVAERCEHFGLPHFSAEAVAKVLETMHRWVEDKQRISSRLADLQQLILSAAAETRRRVQSAKPDVLVERQDVLAVLHASYKRHRHPEMQMLRAIVDGDLMISVQGRELGQINGLTHIDLGDAGFGSPVRISARCFAGEEGVINIDREVEMTGPNHDKGLFILQSWLSASFAKLTPLSLNASLVFEQEYHGVEGDSASCAELYALLSSISGLPLPQGIAVTGAMNQHGEVMAIGGVNEKIEGYFRVCQAIGLDGSQGVLIPERNAAHLVLNEEVVAAVAAGKFQIRTFAHVLEGLEYLTGLSAGELDEKGDYRPESVMGRVQRVLEGFRKIYDSNKSDD